MVAVPSPAITTIAATVASLTEKAAEPSLKIFITAMTATVAVLAQTPLPPTMMPTPTVPIPATMVVAMSTPKETAPPTHDQRNTLAVLGTRSNYTAPIIDLPSGYQEDDTSYH